MSKGNPKDTKTLEKLKQFFRANKSGGAGFRLPEDFVLTPELEKELGPETPITQRIKAIKELSEVVLNIKVEVESVKKLWHCVKDLLQESVPKDHRHVAFHFLRNLIQSQHESIPSLMKVHYFKLIKEHNVAEDLGPRLEMLMALIENGRNIGYLEEEIALFMLQRLGDIVEANRELDFLQVIINLIKYNAAYVDEEILHGFIHNISLMAMKCPDSQVVLSCLQVLDTVLCYTSLPKQALFIYVCCLCRTANFQEYCLQSWKIMRSLLGTHMGHSSLVTMLRLLQTPQYQSDEHLLRGAIFHINMGLWSAKRVEKLNYSHTSILPSLLYAMQSGFPSVVYEIVQAVHRLVTKYGIQLLDPTWDILLAIMESIIGHIENHPGEAVTQLTTSSLHDVFCTIEQMIELGQFNGNVRKIFELMERCSPVRPESSVMRVITFLAQSIVPTRHDWLDKLHSLLNRYLHREHRTHVRLRALEVLSTVIGANRLFYDELIEKVVLHHLENIDQEIDIPVRNSAASMVVELCLLSVIDNKRFPELLDILDKLMLRGFEQCDSSLTEAEAVDVKTTVEGLIKIFTVTMNKVPSTNATRVFRMLVNHLDLHYTTPVVFDNVPSIRLMILECFIRLRVDSKYRIGYPGPLGLWYSPYLLAEHLSTPPTPPAALANLNLVATPAPDLTYLSLTPACNAVITCLRKELDWKVLLTILNGVVQIVKNKALVLSKQDNCIDSLANTLCAMVSDKSLRLPESLRNTPSKFTKSDFHGHVFPILATLASYHTQLEPNVQQRLIKCLEYGLASRSVRQCVLALTSCILEMRDTMVKLLPEVLLNLSKISATVHISIPILEFLSTLARLPRVYANFVGDQYMSVFAIALPYTGPFKYNHYTVSMAHHVIAAWFLKCRLAFRRDFVKFIITGLKSNVLVPFEESQGRLEAGAMNEDSSNRKRSSSLTEQGSRRPASSANRVELNPPPIKDGLMHFHKELTETCVDLMVRYAFSTTSAQPKRTPMAEFLFNEGQSATWIMGNRLITITTSGCSVKPLKNGLCDKCYHTCRLEKDTLRSPSVESAEGRGLNKTALSRSGSSEMGGEEGRKPEPLHDSDPSRLDQLIYGVDRQERSLCSCWCQGWAEIKVRRPTGDVSWTMRMQNEPHSLELSPLSDITGLFLPSLSANKTSQLDFEAEIKASVVKSERLVSEPVSIPGSPVRHSPSRHSSRDGVDALGDEDLDGGSGRSRNPVRRSNSSPEMSAGWKNPFMNAGNQSAEEPIREPTNTSETKKKQTYTKDLRANCEAIPEEMGTTPPTADMALPPHLVPTTAHVQTAEQLKMSAPTVVPQEWTMTKSSDTDRQLAAAREQKPEPAKFAESLNPAETVRANMRDKLREEERGSVKPVASTPHLTGKPPLSPPAQMSPRLQPKLHKTEGEVRPDPSALPPLAFKRDRGHTISVMSPVRKPQLDVLKNRSPRTKEPSRSGISPSFVFLQLYHTNIFPNSTDRPLPIGNSQVVQRAFKNLDRIPPYETHKVGVLYVGPGQVSSEAEILRNPCGSVRYTEFLQKLGTLVRLEDVDPQTVFLGGLECNGNDGKFSYYWQDDVTQVIFHVATLMPSRDNDPNCNAKKLHIGNDYVTIVYNESGEQFQQNTLKCQFNYVSVVVEPLDHGINMITVLVKEELYKLFGHPEPRIVSDQNVALMARQLALHANLASGVACSLKKEGCDPYTSNWLERLRQIKRIRQKAAQEVANENSSSSDRHPGSRRVFMEDFTEYS